MLTNTSNLQKQIETNREIEWREIEELVLAYQQRFLKNDTETIKRSEQAAQELIVRFQPLFLKYLRVIKKNEVNFYDTETKRFVFSFIDKQTRMTFSYNKEMIIYKFKFIVQTYGMLSENEIMSDIHEIFMRILKRYKQIGRNFCGYLYNVFYHEMSRWIKKFISNPLNINYNIDVYDETISESKTIEELIIEANNEKELLGHEWIRGIACDTVFETLSVVDRKILMAYYLNDQNDKQISDNFGLHIITVNQRRQKALKKLLEAMPNSTSLTIIRRRKIGFYAK